MIKAIVSKYNTWYCKRCGVSHKILYTDGKNYYCDSCVPETVKQQAKFINQNREGI